jgi:hypothetical protein
MGFDLLGWLLGWALGGLASAREPERAGSARLGVFASPEKRREPGTSRAEPLRARAELRAASFFSSPSGRYLFFQFFPTGTPFPNFF